MIHIPDMSVPRIGHIPAVSFSKDDFPGDYYSKILEYMKLFTKKKDGPYQPLEYDPATQSYRKKEAKLGATYKLSSTSVHLPDKLAKDVYSWGKENVPDEILYTDDPSMGREDEIHVTVFYGIESSKPDEVQELLKDTPAFECRLGLLTAFKDAETHDVLKIDVESPELVRLHYLIEESVDNKNTRPTYQAHVTIAYLKKGNIDKYLGEDYFRGKTFKVTEIVFSSKDHIETKISLKV
jgi:2'-5' RNA ligase